MKRFARALAATLGLAVIGSVVSLVPQKSATGAGSAPVTVVNTPLPVTGNVNATVSGTVGISGTPTVSLASGGTVNVGNTPLPVVSTPGNVTHVGQLPSSHVVLTAGSAGCTSWIRINPDGTGTFSVPFAIPAGFDLIITDVDWARLGTPGTNTQFNLGVGFGTTGVHPPALIDIALADSAGNAGEEVQLTGGLVMSALPTCGPNQTAILRGYVVPAS